jgi:hypothetical protein
VQPIFNARCSQCHQNGQTSGSLDLSVGSAYLDLTIPSSGCNTAIMLVQPGDPQNSMLWRKLANAPDKCGDPMPRNTAGLKSVNLAEFETIERWISEGAQNN